MFDNFKIPVDPHNSDINLTGHEKIVSLVISPSEEILVVSTDLCQLYHFCLIPSDLSKGQ